MSAPSAIAPARRPRAAVVAAIVVVVVLVYAAVVVLYALSDRRTELAGCGEDPPADAVQFSMTPQSVDAVGDRVDALLDVEGWGPLEAADGGLSEPVTIIVAGTDGAPTFTVGTGVPPSPRTVKLVTTGEVERWPFDTHQADFTVLTIAGQDASRRAVPTTVCGTAHVPGWTFAATETTDDEVTVDGRPVPIVQITASRAPATVAFGLVILGLIALLPVLALTVAVLAYRGARKLEATLTGWMAAMLFAVVPLRSFLPGSPPIGSWVDYLVILWVVAGLVAALVVFVIGWVRWTPRGG